MCDKLHEEFKFGNSKNILIGIYNLIKEIYEEHKNFNN